ncbi:MAG: dihydroorotate dehydrogenase [Actinomycetota bacterium]|nr:dihydroorotate dehydrogenase [Actinomycetota bacterium]
MTDKQNSLFVFIEENNNDINLSVNIGKIHLENPVIMCSGTFGYGEEYGQFYNTALLGAVTTKSYSLKPEKGNPPPRICETPAGLLNSIGLQNDGIDCFIKKHFPEAERRGIKLILSLFGSDMDEFSELAYKVSEIKDKIVAIELNLSCPNVKEGGIAFSSVPADIKKIVRSVKRILKIPVIAKLSPNQHNLIEAAVAAEKGGAEAISIINTVVGMSVDIETFKPRLANVTGGLSGPAIKPIALAKVYSLAKEKILPVIGMGGIFSVEDALEFLIAGASAVGIGTANFIKYDIGVTIIDGLREYLKRRKIHDINEIIGRLEV